MMAPTTLPDALAEIEELRGQVRDLLQLLGQDAKPSDVGVSPSSARTTDAHEFSGGLDRKHLREKAAHTERTQEEEDRLKREALFSLMLKTGPGCIKRVASDGTLLSMNQAGLCMIEIEKEEDAIGLCVFEVVVPEHRAAFIEMHEAVIKGESRTLRFQIQGFHGTTRWMETYAVPFLNPVTGCTEQLAVTHDITMRKEEEETLQEMHLALSQAMPGISRLDHAGCYLEVNEHYASMLGYTPTELVGKSWKPTVHPEDLPLADSAFRQMEQTGKGEFEARGVKKDGSIFWKYILMIKGVHKDAASIGYHCLARDITERKQTETALAASESRFRTVVEGTSDWMWEIDTQGCYVYSSLRVRDLLGYEPEEILGKTPLDFMLPEEAQRVRALLGSIVEIRSPFDKLEKTHRHKDGHLVVLECRGVPILDADGTLRGYRGFDRDITMQKQAEQELRRFHEELESVVQTRTAELTRTQSLLQHVIDSSPDWIFVKDHEHKFLLANQCFAQSQGLNPSTMLGRQDTDFWPLELCEGNPTTGLRGFHADDRAAFAGELIRNPHDPASLADGTLRIFDTYKGPLRDGSGKIYGVLCYCRDVTEQREVERALRDSQARLTRLNVTLEQQVKERTVALQTNEERYARATAVGKVGVWELDVPTGLYHGDANLKDLLGYGPDELSTDPYAWLGLVHPEDQAIALKAWEGIISRSTDDCYYELRMIRKDGTVIWTDVRGHAERDEQGHVQRLIGATVNITERKRAEAILALENWILEEVAAGLPLGDLLEHLASGIEAITHGCRCSILLMDADGLHLRHGAAPSLPASYTAAIDGVAIGPSVGSCGTAAYRNALIVVEDIATDPLWADYKELALGHGLRACWSMPISSSAGKVLGTFAVYYCIAYHPTPDEIQLIEQAVRLAQIAIERSRAEDQLRRTQFAMDQAMDAVYWIDPQARILYVNEAACSMLGYSKAELLTMTVHDLNPEFQADKWPGLLVESRQRGTWSFETQHKAKDGRLVPVDIQVSCLTHKEDEFLCAFVRDITERKRREQALKASGERLRLSLLASNTGLWDWNTETNKVWLSPEWKRQLGYDDAEMPNRFESWESRLHPDDHDRAVAYAMQYRDNPAGTFRQDFRLLHKDGTYRWIDSQASFVTEANDRRVRLLGSHTDITERKQAEETLSESEARFRTLVSNIPGAIYRCAVDREWTMSYLSHVIEEIVGYPAAEFIGNHTRSYASVIHPDDRRLVEEGTVASLRERRPYVLEYRLIHANGEVRWVYEKGQGVFTPDGEVRFLDGAIFDITERKRVEETLRLTQFSIDRAVDGVFWVAPDARILNVNEAACRMLEYSREELTTMTVHDIDPTFSPEAWLAHWEELKRNGSMTFESRHWSSTGRVLDTEVTENYLLYEDLEYNCTIVRDIGERKRAEESLRQSEARLNEAQRIAHIGSWELDLRVNHLTWSDEIFRIFEIDQHQFGASYEAFLSLVHPDDQAAVDRAYTNSVRDRTPYDITHRLLMPDGRVKHVQERCETMYDAQGTPQRSFGTVQDVTERMRMAEREAARAEQLKRLSELSLTLSGDPAEIFERIVKMIGDLFKVRVVCLSEIDGQKLHFKTDYLNGQVEHNAGRCPMAVTPCATVERDKELRMLDCLRERFPQASFMQDHQARSYCGFPVLDAHGRVVAVTCLLDDKPREFTAEEQALLRVFGQRIAMELERARYLADQARQAEERERSHTFIRQIIDTDPNFIFAKDRDGRFTLVNKAVAEAYGTTVDNLLGKRDADFNPHRDEVAYFAKKDLEILDSLQERFIPEEKMTDATGQIRWLQTVKRPLIDNTGRATMVLSASTDITARKGVEEALRRRESDLKAAIAERERISEDLHDGILQSIYAVGLGLEACKPLIADQPKQSGVKLKTALQRTIGQLNYVLQDVRNFIAGLESQILDGQEFDVVLRTMGHALAASYSVPCRMTIEKAAAQRLSTGQAYHVMNVAREALSNSFRHSHAEKIALSLKCLSRSVRLSVTDNGVGFNPSAARDTGHGLANMESRASKIGGTVTLRSKPGGGTKIILDLPIMR